MPQQSPAGSAAAGHGDEASLAHACATFRACQRWLESLGLAHPEHLFDPEHDICYCDGACAARHPDEAERGGERYGLPKGWCGFGLQVDAPQFARREIWETWHVAFHGTTKRAACDILNGDQQLLKAGDVTSTGHKIHLRDGHITKAKWRTNEFTGKRELFNPRQIFTSPSIKYCAAQDEEGDYYYLEEDELDGQRFLVALQVMEQPPQQPGGYDIGQQTLDEGGLPELDHLFPNKQIEHYTDRRGVHKIYRILVKLATAEAATGARTPPEARRDGRRKRRRVARDAAGEDAPAPAAAVAPSPDASRKRRRVAPAAAAREQPAQPARDAQAQASLNEQLCDAAGKGDAAAIERLAAEGASPDAKNKYGTPAVWWAAVQGHAGAVSALVRLGADLDARDSYGYTALMQAAYSGKLEIARALLAGGADRTLRATRGRYRGKTALEIAEAKGEAGVAALLRSPVAFEARATARAALTAEMRAALDGQLFGAARDGDATAIERLAAEGASPDAKDKYGYPAVCGAAFKGHAGAVSALVRLGADLGAREDDGVTALMAAASNGEVECARALLAGGADRTLRATGNIFKGKTALEIAEACGRAEVAALLRV